MDKTGDDSTGDGDARWSVIDQWRSREDTAGRRYLSQLIEANISLTDRGHEVSRHAVSSIGEALRERRATPELILSLSLLTRQGALISKNNETVPIYYAKTWDK